MGFQRALHFAKVLISLCHWYIEGAPVSPHIFLQQDRPLRCAVADRCHLPSNGHYNLIFSVNSMGNECEPSAGAYAATCTSFELMDNSRSVMLISII